jgi:hypothetical protein
LKQKETRKQLIWSFGTGTISAIGLSSFILLPAYKQIAASARLAESQLGWKQQILDVLNATDFVDYRKIGMLFGASLSFALILKGVFFFRKDKINTIFVVFCIMIVTIPAIL